MKTSPFVLLFPIVAVIACQKEIKTKPVDFSATEYSALRYDSSSGKPRNMVRETISTEMTSYIKNTLPESKDLRKVNPELLNSNTTVDLKITQKSDVFLTFVSRATKYKNAIAYYAYTTGNPPANPKDIEKITYVFPSAGSGSPLKPGDKVKIGSFEAGTSIGLVLLKDAWNPTAGTLNNAAVHFCYNDALNPEVDPKLKKHVVLMNYQAENKILIGFEDIDRTDPECDHDFNDIVLYATIQQ
jgi:hypothetical protein